MQIQIFKSGILYNNNYLVWDEKSKEAVLIDCSSENQKIIDFLNEKSLKLKYILLTHGHFDHMLGVDFFQEKLNVSTYLNKEDAPLLSQINFFTDMAHLPHIPSPNITHFFDKNTLFSIGKEKIKIFSTPGHSKGGSCFSIQNHLFSGDTLFAGTYGRTDCIGGSNEEMEKSLKFLFQQFPDDTLVYPGHGPVTTIGQEKGLYKF